MTDNDSMLKTYERRAKDRELRVTHRNDAKSKPNEI